MRHVHVTTSLLAAVALPMPSVRITAARMLDDDQKLALIRMGLAVPGMEKEGRAASQRISKRMDEAGVIEIGKAQQSVEKRSCTRDEPCEVDAQFLRSLALTPGPVLLLVAFAYSVGVAAYSAETDDDWLERQAERSRARRLKRQREFGAALQPLQQWTGWTLVTGDGTPTSDAYVFLAVAVAAQLTLAASLAAPLQDAFGG